MAKRRRQSNQLGDAAESIGHVLGVLTNKVEHVNMQRAAVSKEIAGFISHAQDMLNKLGHDMPVAKKRFMSAMADASKPGRRAGYQVSAAAKRKMSIAAKKRWAAIKAAAAAKK